MKTFFRSCFWLLLWPVFSVSAQAPAPSAPFIFYFSDVLNSFVIERADGSDSSQFAEKLFSEGIWIINNASWSPSGRWFAFTALGRGRGLPSKNIAFIVSVDEKTVIPLRADSLFWSPSSDLLFNQVGSYLGVFDPQKNRVVFEHSFEGSLSCGIISLTHSFFCKPLWNTEGNAVFFTEYDEGQVTIYELNTNFFQLQKHVMPLINNFGVSETSHYIYYRADQHYLYIYDPIARHLWKLKDHAFSSDISTITWNSQHNRAILSGSIPYDVAVPRSQQIFSLSLEDESLHLLATIPNAHGCCETMWSPDGDQAVISTGDSTLPTLIFDTQTQELRTVNVPLCYLWLDERHCLYAFRTPEMRGRQIRLLDTESLTTETFISATFSEWITPSPDNRYFHLGGTIYDFETRQPLTPDPNPITVSRLWSDVLWHDSSNWAIFGSQFQNRLAGTDIGLERYGIATLDGVIKRELTTCYYYNDNICVWWLPSRVERQLSQDRFPTSVIPSPYFSLVFDEPVSNAQLSADNHQLEVITDDTHGQIDPVTVSLWDVQSGEQTAQRGCFRTECLGLLSGTTPRPLPAFETTQAGINNDQEMRIAVVGRTHYLVDQITGNVELKWPENGIYGGAKPAWVNNTLFFINDARTICVGYWHRNRGWVFFPFVPQHCVFSPDHSLALFFPLDQSTHPANTVLYDTQSGEQTLINFYAAFADFSLDGEHILLEVRGKLTLWDVDDLLQALGKG